MLSNPVVIGSNCFTGCHIVDALLGAGYERVVGVSRSPEYDPVFLPYKRHGGGFEFHQIDFVRDWEALQALLDGVRPQLVINVAALSEVGVSNERPLQYFNTNTVGTVKLCDHLRQREYIAQYVHISSAEIFGPCTGAVDEGVLFNPSTPYAVSKAAADMYINNLIANFDFPATLVRSTNVYGRHQQLFKIIPRTAIYIKQGKAVELHGGGQAVKSFIHIRDVVSGLMAAVAGRKLGTYHFSVPSDRTVAAVVASVCERMGADFDVSTRVVGERLGQDARYLLDCAKAERELAWSPTVDFDEGVCEVVAWIEEHWDLIKTLPLEYQHKA